MKTISIKSKAIIFGRYPSQLVKKGNFKRELLSVNFDPTESFSIAESPGLRMQDYFKDFPKVSLLLTPLAKITDEHVLEVSKITYKWVDRKRYSYFERYQETNDPEELMYVKSICMNTVYTDEFSLAAYQYLHLLGYALPQTVIEDGIPVIYTVDELVKQHVFTLR